MRREIRDSEGNVVWQTGQTVSADDQRSGVVITVAYNRGTTVTGLLPGDRLYEDGELVFEQEPDRVPDLMKALKASLDAVRAQEDR